MLSEDLKQSLIQILAETRMDSMFDKHGIQEIVYDGLTIPGLNNMTDEQLVDEYADLCDEHNEFLAELRIDLESHKLLTTPTNI